MLPKYTRIEYHSKPDKLNRVMFTLFWLCTYFPGHPDGEYQANGERAQVFFANPEEYGFPISLSKNRATNR